MWIRGFKIFRDKFIELHGLPNAFLFDLYHLQSYKVRRDDDDEDHLQSYKACHGVVDDDDDDDDDGDKFIELHDLPNAFLFDLYHLQSYKARQDDDDDMPRPADP
jgi:hypothetical protein